MKGAAHHDCAAPSNCYLHRAVLQAAVVVQYLYHKEYVADICCGANWDVFAKYVSMASARAHISRGYEDTCLTQITSDVPRDIVPLR